MKKIWIEPMIFEVEVPTPWAIAWCDEEMARFEKELALLLYGNYVADAPPHKGMFAK